MLGIARHQMAKAISSTLCSVFSIFAAMEFELQARLCTVVGTAFSEAELATISILERIALGSM